jgi:predicted MFS family arabinose efflux permease
LRSAAGELTLVGATVLLLSTTAFFRVPLLPEIGRDLTMSVRQLGLVTSMFAAGRLLTDLPAGRLLERVRTTGLLTTSATIMLIGSAAMSVAGHPVIIYAAAFGMGVASAITNATGMHAFSVAAPRRRRGTSLAVYSTALLSGQAFGPFVGGTIAAATSWRVALAVAAGACALFVTALVWAHARSAGSDRQAPRTVSASEHPRTPARSRWSAQQTALLFIAFTMFLSVGAMPETLIPLIGAGDHGLHVAWIGAGLGVGGVCRLIGGFVGGIVADRVSRRAALVPGLALQAAGIALVAGAGTGWWLAGIIVMSLASWGIAVGATVLADLAPEGHLGPQLGTFRFVGDVGLVVGPLLATQLYELAGRAVAVGAVAALLATAAVWCAVSVPETSATR